jgi:small nuclear ribonucleoprotein (snRNP)-like protein
MSIRKVIIVLFIGAVCFMLSQSLFAQEGKFELNKASAVKDILIEHVGKRISIKLDGGEELEGIVTKVGDHLVHISKLSKRDFYDALIRIDRISAVILRVRSN